MTRRTASTAADGGKNNRLRSSRKHSANSAFWDNILRAAEAEPRKVNSIRGASGIEHPLLASGVDERRQRLIIISPDHDARSAAMMQGDIQSAFDSIRIVVARPVLFSLPQIARSISREADDSKDSLQAKFISALAEQALGGGLDLLEAGGMLQYMSASLNVFRVLEDESEAKDNEIRNLDEIISKVQAEKDNEFGLCPVPMYKFSDNDFEIISSGKNIDVVTDILVRLNVFQYFFPPPDNLALGIVDRAPITNVGQLADQITQAPQLGHPFGSAEITRPNLSIPQMIDELRERNLVVEGEVGFELRVFG